MLTIISPYAVECPNSGAHMLIHLGVQHQEHGQRRVYLPKEREEGEADIMLKPFTQATVYLLSREGIKFTCKSL